MEAVAAPELERIFELRDISRRVVSQPARSDATDGRSRSRDRTAARCTPKPVTPDGQEPVSSLPGTGSGSGGVAGSARNRLKRARAAFRDGDYDAAAAAATAAAEAAEDREQAPRAVWRRAQALERMGRLVEAMQDVKSLIDGGADELPPFHDVDFKRARIRMACAHLGVPAGPALAEYDARADAEFARLLLTAMTAFYSNRRR